MEYVGPWNCKPTNLESIMCKALETHLLEKQVDAK